MLNSGIFLVDGIVDVPEEVIPSKTISTDIEEDFVPGVEGEDWNLKFFI